MPARSDDVRGSALDGYFRCLGYIFRLRADSPEAAQRITPVLAGFEVTADRIAKRVPNIPTWPPVYSVSEGGAGWEVRYGDDLLFGPEPLDELLSHLFWHINSETSRLTGSYLLVHAGVVASPSGDAIILPGDSGSGKTTVVAGLLGKGFAYLSDEAAAIDPVSRTIHPFPKALTLKRGSFGLFPELESAGLDEVVRLENQWFVSASTLGAQILPGSRHCARWIVTVRYQAGAQTRLDAISPAETLLELGRRVMNMSHYEARALEILADVVRGTSGYRLLTGDLTEAVAVLEDVASSGTDRASHRVSSGLSPGGL